MRKKVLHADRPNLDKRWFWEMRYDEINWHECYVTIIERIIERGGETEWKELIRFYGREKVINTIKNEITFLHDHAIEDACNYFLFKKEELFCVKRRKTRIKDLMYGKIDCD